MKIILLFLVFSVIFVNTQDFGFQISATMGNAKAVQLKWYDLCGFDCSSEGRVVSSYCDSSCRQYNNYFDPLCYRTCPSLFQQDKSSQIQLRWGAPAGNRGQSGMGFSTIPGGRGSFNVQQEFKVGELTHYNFPIDARTVVSDFDFSFFLSISRNDKILVSDRKFTFKMHVDETPNNQVPSNCGGSCPYPSRFSTCNPPPGCPDKINFPNQVASEVEFDLEGVSYTFALTGFRPPGKRKSESAFISDETLFTTVEIWAVVTRACPDCTKLNTEAVWNQDTFTCTCVCSNTCPRGQIRLPDCTCGCPEDFCGVKAKAKPTGNECECDCTTGDPTQCVLPRVPGKCPDNPNKCCCVCPDNKCPPPSKPNEKFASCDCMGCPTCTQGKNFVASPDNCTCYCPLTEKNCDRTFEVFNKEKCECECKADCNKTQDFVEQNCNCLCDKGKLERKCKEQNREISFVPFDPAKPEEARCTCGPCIGNFTANTNNQCECLITCEGNYKVDAKECKCVCPPEGIKCESPLVFDPRKCACSPCTPGQNCDCPPERKQKCEELKRVYIFNETFCGCANCINQFEDTDIGKNEAKCEKCPLTNDTCKKGDSNSMMIVDLENCKCICSPENKCPNERDIYEPDTCSCRPCKEGECICGNGFVEAGEECDPGKTPTECCEKCKVLDNAPCLQNKCGKCVKVGDNVTCQDISGDLCKSDECFNSTCVSDNGVQRCEIQTFDGKQCGPGGDLCLRRCLEGKCVDYEPEVIRNRCAKDNAPAECGECCSYSCQPSTGKCEVKWDQLNQTCNDDLLCTVNDTCISNPENETAPLQCVGKPKCTEENIGRKPFGFPCTKFECSEPLYGTCVEVPSGPNVTCPADGFCSLPGNCSLSGECIQPRRSCDTTKPCEVGRCRENPGRCEFISELADGLPCDDGDNCTEGDICVSGSCQGKQSCNATVPTGGVPLIPLVVTAAVVAAAALVAGFFIFQAIQGANIMDPVSWGEVNTNQFDANPLYQEATKFGDNPLYQS